MIPQRIILIMFERLSGLPKGIKRFLKTGKIDAMVYSVFEYRRNHKYPNIFD